MRRFIIRRDKGTRLRVAVDVDPYRIYFKYKKAVFEDEPRLPPSKPMTLTPPLGREVIIPERLERYHGNGSLKHKNKGSS